MNKELDETKKAISSLPSVYQRIVNEYPAVAAAHDQMAVAVEGVGPLDAKTCSLIKIGISVGAGLESAVRSHVRRATQAGATRVEITQAIFLGMNTVGFPRTVSAWSWAQMQFERDDKES
ncbi:MAG: carboxymuconolactone decarboxylase family protein [Planctomycetota bacterium]|nr:carboxymuconolactone decarboxylase family protein [Planctomycetota bacterium]